MATKKSAPQIKVIHGARFKAKADTVMVTTQPEETDPFKGSYVPLGNNKKGILEPPFNLIALLNIVHRNCMLSQCIDVMEVSVEATGYSLELKEASAGGPEIDKELLIDPDTGNALPPEEAVPELQHEKQIAADFFGEPFPQWSMTKLRRARRRDLEGCGNAYIEACENIKGELKMLRYIEAQFIRLVKLDDPVPVEVIIRRGGKDEKVTLNVRERRFARVVGAKVEYYSEYGATREVHKETGDWHPKGTLKPEERGGKLIWETVNKDPNTAYGIPRWINNLPAVLGSRKAEEYNLEFFDAGGLPPVIILLQGGAMTDPVRDQLLLYLSGTAKTKTRAAVVDVQSTSGSLESAGKVDMKVERFGAERQSDGMFQTYTANSDEKVRRAFRIPPIFMGDAVDFAFASAVTSVKVAEMQVFQPEREEFDAMINMKVLPALGVKSWVYKSKPLYLNDVELQRAVLEMIKGHIAPEEYVRIANLISNLSAVFDKSAHDAAMKQQNPFLPQLDEDGNPVEGAPRGPQDAGEQPKPGVGAAVKKKSDAQEIYLENLAGFYRKVAGLDAGGAKSQLELERVARKIEALDGDMKNKFSRILSAQAYATKKIESDLSDIVNCIVDNKLV